jgi:hypothetical protein
MGLSLLIAALLGTEPGWEKVSVSGDVDVFRRNIPGSHIKSVKGVGVVYAPVDIVSLVLIDDEHAAEWVDSLAEARVLQVKSPFEYLEYNHASMPLIVSDRDFVTKVTMSVDELSGTVTILSEPVNTSLMPPRPGIVRGQLSGRYILEPIHDGAHTKLTVEIHADPKGLLPPFVVNFFQKDWAQETIGGIRRQTAKKSLSPPAAFTEFLKLAASSRSAR